MARLPISRFFQPGSRQTGRKFFSYERFIPVTAANFVHLRMPCIKVADGARLQTTWSNMAANLAMEDTSAPLPPKRFRWSTEMISQLISCLTEYKSNMEYKSLDFDADKQTIPGTY